MAEVIETTDEAAAAEKQKATISEERRLQRDLYALFEGKDAEREIRLLTDYLCDVTVRLNRPDLFEEMTRKIALAGTAVRIPVDRLVDFMLDEYRQLKRRAFQVQKENEKRVRIKGRLKQ